MSRLGASKPLKFTSAALTKSARTSSGSNLFLLRLDSLHSLTSLMDPHNKNCRKHQSSPATIRIKVLAVVSSYSTIPGSSIFSVRRAVLGRNCSASFNSVFASSSAVGVHVQGRRVMPHASHWSFPPHNPMMHSKLQSPLEVLLGLRKHESQRFRFG